MPVSLFHELKRGGFHSSISTTFSVDPAFYDSTIQYKLRIYGCLNNILLVDQGMLTRALSSTPEAFQKAGLDYVVKGLSHSKSFHPKILARYGRNKARLIIGSANATCAGWGRNLEALSVISWNGNSDNNDNQIYRDLVHKTHTYLMSLIPEVGNENLTYKRRLLHRESPWIDHYDQELVVSELEDGTLIDVLFGFPSEPSSLFSQFISKIQDKPTGFSIISPYWDSDLSTLRNLWRKFGQLPTKIWVNTKVPEMSISTFPRTVLSDKEDIAFFQTPSPVEGRFPHAKILCVQTENHEHILFGSANCTFAALGNDDRPGLNDEACIYRRVPKNTLADQLGLNEDIPVMFERLQPPDVADEEIPTTPCFDPGTLQLFGRKIVWTPKPGISVSGSAISIRNKTFKVQSTTETQGFVHINSENVNTTIVAIVELQDGHKSRPVIIEVPEVLKSAAPSSIQKGLQDKLNQVISGESDLMNLARDFHLIFASEPDSAPTALRANQKSRATSTDKMGIDYDSPEAFREALTLSHKMKRQDLSHADNPALQAILKIVMRGLISFTDQDEREARRKAEAAALESGEFDDGADHDDNDEYLKEDSEPSTTFSEKKAWAETINLATFEKNQYYLLKVIGEMEVQIEELSKKPKKITLEFITQILFVFYLMMYGCTHEYQIENEKRRTLISFGFSTSNDRSKIFLLRAAVMIKTLWGETWEKNLFRHFSIGQNQQNLPMPFYTLIVLSRWIMAAILVEVSDKKEHASLKRILTNQIPKIFASTFSFTIDESEMIEIIKEIQDRTVSKKLFRKRVLLELRSMTNAIKADSKLKI